MTGVTLRLDGPRWREHLRTVAGAAPGLVPVIKGNGYGYGLRRLAQESAELGVDTIAVGTAGEVSEVREEFPGDIVILHPWEASSEVARQLAGDDRVITTVSRADDLAWIAELNSRPRVLIEVLTSMQNFAPPTILAQASRLNFSGGPSARSTAVRRLDHPPAPAGRAPLRRGRAACSDGVGGHARSTLVLPPAS